MKAILTFLFLLLSTSVFAQDTVPNSSYHVTTLGNTSYSDAEYVVKLLSVVYPHSKFSTVFTNQEYKITVYKSVELLHTVYYMIVLKNNKFYSSFKFVE